MSTGVQTQVSTAAPAPSFTPVQTNLLQRKCACGGTPGVDGECAECRAQRLTLQRKMAGGSAPGMPSQRLDLARATLNHPSIGHDFSQVRVLAAEPGIPQAKLTVGQPYDQYEQEADRVAEQVVAMPGGDLAGAAPEPPRDDEGEIADLGGALPELPQSAESSIAALRGGGQPLPVAERAFMEPRFGYRFDQIRIHTGPAASHLARGLAARAFTVGQDVVFGESEYKPQTGEGRRLLAHELTHVVQQSQFPGPLSTTGLSEPRVQRQYLVGPPEEVSAATTTGPDYGDCRLFNWEVSWSTRGRNGFIVQECINADTITRCDGTNVPVPNTPHYWEAWPVNASGAVGDGGIDTWFRAQRMGTRGRWLFDSNVHFVPSLDPAAGFRRSAVPTAGTLLSTTTAPTNLYQPAMSRHAGGVWDCCEGNNYHRRA